MTLSSIVDVLRCPVCHNDMAVNDNIVVCARGHSFDIARHGYVSLLSNSAARLRSDTSAMIAARDRVQTAGYFDPIAEEVTVASSGSTIVDVGVGNGFYLQQVVGVQSDRRGVGIDLSKAAARYVARRHHRIGAIVADVWAPVPVRDNCADTILSIFSPRNGDEFVRMLDPDGVLVVVTPTAQHLQELVAALGMIGVDPAKSERLDSSIGARFTRTQAREITYRRHADEAVIADLVGMGPSAHHLSPTDIADRTHGPLNVTFSVTVARYELAAS